MASAFREPIQVLAWRERAPHIIYVFDSANKAALFTHADVKSILQVCSGQRRQAVGWHFCTDSTDRAMLVRATAAKLVFTHDVLIA